MGWCMCDQLGHTAGSRPRLACSTGTRQRSSIPRSSWRWCGTAMPGTAAGCAGDGKGRCSWRTLADEACAWLGAHLCWTGADTCHPNRRWWAPRQSQPHGSCRGAPSWGPPTCTTCGLPWATTGRAQTWRYWWWHQTSRHQPPLRWIDPCLKWGSAFGCWRCRWSAARPPGRHWLWSCIMPQPLRKWAAFQGLGKGGFKKMKMKKEKKRKRKTGNVRNKERKKEWSQERVNWNEKEVPRVMRQTWSVSACWHSADHCLLRDLAEIGECQIFLGQSLDGPFKLDACNRWSKGLSREHPTINRGNKNNNKQRE